MAYDESVADPPPDSLLDDIVAASPMMHAAGASSPKVLAAIARHLRGRRIHQSVETGSGATTLLFSHLSEQHTVFALDDGSGSINRVRSSLLLNAATTTFVEGATQRMLPAHHFTGKLQAALLDGPHAFPFPQLEYYYIYPRLEQDALLVLDDIHIRSSHQLYRFLKADEMFEVLEVVDRAAFFRRTAAPVFDPWGDGWWMQGYNQRTLLRFVWQERLRESIPPALRSMVKSLLQKPGRRSSLRILEPQPRDRVGSSGVVRGAGWIPPDKYLWLLARRKDQSGWWPQGGGPVKCGGAEWKQRCNYGGPADVGHEFEIAAIVVDAPTHRRLERWVEEGAKSGDHPPIELPRPSGCLPVKLTVVKDKDP